MTEPADVRLPSRFLADLSDRCGRAGTEAAGALRDAGRELGVRLVELLPEDRAPDRASPEAFWQAVAAQLAERGLGELSVKVRTGSVADLRLARGPEPDGAGPEEARRGCHLATGLLAGILTGAAGNPVAVLEVACAADDDGPCRWLAGSPDTLEGIRRRMEAGASVREALEAP